MEALEILFTASLWAAAIRIASPLIFATLGELICERAGVLNLGIEGIMTVGAFAGWLTVYMGGDLWFGVIVAALAGMVFGFAACGADRTARAFAACDRHRHYAACNEPHLLRLSAHLSGGDVAAQDRALHAMARSGPERSSLHRRGFVPADAADLSCLHHGGRRRLAALQDAGRTWLCARRARTRQRSRRKASMSSVCGWLRSCWGAG